MDAVCGEEKSEENELESSKSCVCCNEQSVGGARSEDGLPQICEKGRHSVRYVQIMLFVGTSR